MVNPKQKITAEKAQDALNQLSSGRYTINQIRKSYGLIPIESGNTYFAIELPYSMPVLDWV